MIATRRGSPLVLVIEAKHGTAAVKSGSLAKTKLAYPISAVLSGGQVPTHVPVVGVYLRTYMRGHDLFIHIAECDWPGMEALHHDIQRASILPAVTSLSVARAVSYRLALPADWPT